MIHMTGVINKFFIKKVLFSTENEFTELYSLNREYFTLFGEQTLLHVEVVYSTIRTGLMTKEIAEFDIKKYISEEKAQELINCRNEEDFINYINEYITR